MIVLDTHVLIWLIGSPERISKTATVAIQETRLRAEMPAVSCQSFYEIARSIVRGRVKINSPLAAIVESIEMRFHVIPLSAQIGRLAAELSSSFPGDPFDRIIAASAIAHGASLVTADKNIRRSKEVKTIW